MDSGGGQVTEKVEEGQWVKGMEREVLTRAIFQKLVGVA